MDHLVVPIALLALALGVIRVASWAAAGAWAIALRRGASSLARWTPLVLGLPVVLGLATALGVLVPADPLSWLAGHCHCEAGDLIHICPFHPPDPWPLLPLSLVAFGLAAAQPVLRLARLARDLRLTASLAPPVANAAYPQLADLPGPNAITVGWWHPRIAVDRAWWSGLSEFERRVVLSHEEAHVQRRDPLTLLVLRLLAAFAPAGWARKILRQWEDHAEALADRHAGHTVGDPVAVAELLVRQHRVIGALPGFVTPWSGGRVEHRVRTLLSHASHPVLLDPDLDGFVLLGMAGLLALVLSCAPRVHAAIEAALNYLL